MPNSGEYYVEGFTGQEHALIKVEQIVASLQALATGLNRLPGVRELHEDRVTAVTATGGPTNYTVTMNPAPTAYTDGMALNVRFPVANEPNPTLSVLGPGNTSLGTKPIRQVDGSALGASHVAANARAELYYVAEGSGFWTLGAGARGIQGLPGPPDGTFSVNSMKELIFTATGGSVTNLGAIAPLFQGIYSAGTEYSFMDLVRSGAYLYLYINLTPSTGTAVTTATHWQRYSDLPVDGGMLVEFRTATSQGDPGNGRMRFNNSTLASVTEIYLDDQDTNGNDLAAWVQSWDDYGAAPNAQLVIKGTGGNTETIIFNLTAVQDLSGYSKLTVSHVAGTDLPANGDVVSVVPLLRGDTGADGAPGVIETTATAYASLTPDNNTFYIVAA